MAARKTPTGSYVMRKKRTPKPSYRYVGKGAGRPKLTAKHASLLAKMFALPPSYLGQTRALHRGPRGGKVRAYPYKRPTFSALGRRPSYQAKYGGIGF